MRDSPADDPFMTFRLRSLRWASMLLGLWNLGLVLIGGFLILSASPRCFDGDTLPLGFVTLTACARIGCMAAAANAQQATAAIIVGHSMDGTTAANALESRLERKRRYSRWLWWTRLSVLVGALQFLVALYLMYIILKVLSRQVADSAACFLGHVMKDTGWKKFLMVSFLVLVWLVAIIQCLTGSDVLRWRSFYATRDTAWKAHYSEVFDHGIREALCCLGRVKYLSVLEEDDVYFVARLLGDLMAYRASGTGHIDLLAGLALLQSHKQSPELCNEFVEAPGWRLREATLLHKFAEAAYTGPLLDFGRNPVLFPCSWLYRQGVLNPWTCKRLPILDGDNLWRGHAAAFLKFVDLPPEALRHGRVYQNNREVAYFIVVLHDVRTVVIAVRGTETPEDLITDGLCRECNLSEDDLDGLINRDQLLSNWRETVLTSFPHYGHSGIVESARELCMQVDGRPGEVMTSETSGFLISLLGPGCECDGYKVRIVGHSLGGAVATLLGLRLKGRYPNLHVYAYGPLPCVDLVIAEACSAFVTAIVYNDEFSSRLSVNSILRLRAAAVQALSDDSSANSAVVSKFARKVINSRRHHVIGEIHRSLFPSIESSPNLLDNGSHGSFQCGHAVSCSVNSSKHQYSSHAIGERMSESVASGRRSCTLASESSETDQERPSKLERSVERSPFDDPNSDILNEVVYENSIIDLPRDGLYAEYKANEFHDDNFNPTRLLAIQSSNAHDPTQPNEVIGELKEVFLPGLIIHIVPQRTSISPIWKFCVVKDVGGYKAYVASRENFKDITVSPYMFLDHLPWRCLYAMQGAVETRDSRVQHSNDLFSAEDMV